VLSKVRVQQQEEVERMEAQRQAQAAEAARHAQAQHANPEDEPQEQGSNQPMVRDERKVGRNEACPCGSGKKYKQCHGQIN
ncbi:MAG: SEC-C metal-binding domain-containing protein, partial [Vibrio sp.]